jgi:hypothetical protein
VLSAAVTELTDTGAKKTTKVFAGGAVIAEQRTEINSHVEWISADPVTGSSVRLRKDGAFYDDDREEAEPLGQLVLPVQPYEEMPSAEGTEIRTADEPEWLCAAMSKNGVSFMDLPTVCKTIALNSGRADFYDLHPISSPTEIASGNAHATSTGTGRGEKPVLRTAERLSPEELARRRALAATGKFDNEGDEESGSIIDSNIPGADIGRLNGVTDLSERELSRESESGDCLGALHAVNANEEAYRRAIKHRADLERAVQNHVDVSENFRDSFGWQMLAAIGIRESGFMARDEIGGGGGRGVFQITGASVSDEILNSVEKSAGWVLTNRIANVYMEPVAQGQARSVLWTLRNYNAGGASSHGRRMSLAILKSGSVNAADWDRGTAYPGLDTKKAPIDLNKGNYVTSILRIARDCFGDPKIGINF